MRAILKEIGSPDCEFATFSPPDPSDFSVLLELVVGQEDSVGGDIFQLMVCSPGWIQRQYRNEGMVWGRHMLIALEFDWQSIKALIEREIGECEGKDWSEVAMKLSRFAAWEFEDYH
jgi:hypothetical protein